MPRQQEPDYTIGQMQSVVGSLKDKTLAVQIAREVCGTLVSVVYPQQWELSTVTPLNNVIARVIKKGRAEPGSAIGIVPDGPNIYVAVMGGKTVGINTAAAQYIAKTAVAAFAGESLA